MSDYQIHGINFEGDVVSISYITSTDVRVKGMVGIAHQVQLSLEHPDYAEDFHMIEVQIVRALRNALQDWNESEPYVPTNDGDDFEMGSRGPVTD